MTELRPRAGVRRLARDRALSVDAIGGHFLAEAAVQSFLEDVVEQLRRELPESR